MLVKYICVFKSYISTKGSKQDVCKQETVLISINKNSKVVLKTINLSSWFL